MSAHELALALRAAYLALHRSTDASLALCGITADQFVVLAALSEGDALSQRDLVSRASSDPNTLRAMLVLLERKGLVQRRPHATDGRARTVALTPQGRRTLAQAWSQSEPVRKRLAGSRTERNLASLAAQLRELVAGLEQVPDKNVPIARRASNRASA
jgi:DNA-binding MarR family transcriptional regulator